MQSYNSYRHLSKKKTIVEILRREQRPLGPKEITWISKADSRFNNLNYNTVRVYCRQLLEQQKIQQQFFGHYSVTENRYGVGGLPEVLVHDLRLGWDVGLKREVYKLDDVVGGVAISCQFGSKRGKVSAMVACDEGMDFHTVCFAVDRIRRAGLEKAGINLDLFECEVCCEINQDFETVRLDGVKCVTVRSFLGDLERIYNKDDGLRSEIKVAKTDLESMYAMLKGGTSTYNILQSQFLLLQKMDKMLVRLERIADDISRRRNTKKR